MFKRRKNRYYHCYTCGRNTYQEKIDKKWCCDGNTEGAATQEPHDPSVLPKGVILGF